MKLSEVVELVENHPDLHPYLDKILKKNKKTQVSYLESLNRLAYLLYLLSGWSRGNGQGIIGECHTSPL